MTSKPPEFGPTQRLQKAYEAAIRKIVRRVLPPSMPSLTVTEWLEQIAQRSREADVMDASEFLAKRMIFWVNVRNLKTWREAAARSQSSRKLYSLLQHEMRGATGARVTQLVRENAALISSLPLKSAITLSDEIRRAQQAGSRPETIAKMVRTRFPELLRSRVKLISRTETHKASTALTRARCDDLNLDWYLWRTSEDGRVRASHKKMDGVLCSWNDPPSPEALAGEKPEGRYAVGEIYNCRCVPIVLLSAQDVSWPHRVHYHGSIKQMTLPDFKKIAQNVEERAA